MHRVAAIGFWGTLMLVSAAAMGAEYAMTNRTNDADESRVQVTVELDPHAVVRQISPYLTGFNVSYFSDLDTVWADGRIPVYLERVRAGILRYPGGEETSRYHWEHPGARGYRDVWDKEGFANRKTGWKWPVDDLKKDDPDHMDTLDFLTWCDVIGCEPMLGVNVSSGLAFDRLQDSLDEIARWYEFCRAHGYRVRFWYVDNEPWHHDTYHPMDIAVYANVVTQVSGLLKRLDPDIKIVCNPVSAAARQRLRRFVEKCGQHIDIVDLHWYWNWGHASFESWKAQTPMTTDSQFSSTGRTYADEIRAFRKMVRDLGHDHIRLASHEWNVGPSPEGVPISGYVHALITAEMMFQFAEGGLHSACMWPLQWVWDRERTLRQIEEGTYKEPRLANRSIISQKPPHNQLPALETFTLFGRMLGGRVLETTCTADDLPVLAVRQGRTLLIYLLDKSGTDRTLRIQLSGEEESARKGHYEMVTSTDVLSNACSVIRGECEWQRNGCRFALKPFSFVLLTMQF